MDDFVSTFEGQEKMKKFDSEWSSGICGNLIEAFIWTPY